jgi:thioredoxin-like negative regulator of GroEL
VIAKSAPALLFFTSVRSGPARRMESLLTTLIRKERGRLKVVTVDADASPAFAHALGVADVPTLVLVRGRRPVGRIEGRASGPQIEAMIRPHLADAPHHQRAA